MPVIAMCRDGNGDGNGDGDGDGDCEGDGDFGYVFSDRNDGDDGNGGVKRVIYP